MSPSNLSAEPMAPNQSPDTQQLVALLGSLLPLLVRFQSHNIGPLFEPDLGFVPARAGIPAPIGLADPALDHQAAVNLIENITADSLRALSTYLEANARNNAALENCIPIVTQAAHSFAARDYTQAFNQICQAYRGVTLARAINPQLPALGSAAAATTSTPPAAASVH
jgi:hypothetical protein